MRIRLVVVTDIRGTIARNKDDPVNWSSKEDKRFFKQTTSESGVVVMGRKTYESIGGRLPGRTNVVMSRQKEINLPQKPDYLISGTPHEVVSLLSGAGYKDICVIGGQSVFTQFVDAGLVTDIYLSVEPVLLAGGLNLLEEVSNELTLKLERILKLNDNGTINLHYRVY
ncbi:MAG TPA: dihydrofolate reductase family protein [Fervidobacterium sp.]|nr:dihydrofolate reductase family protein [Fervidobacterium sp.]HPT53638.1 dihydrofolate reductase family protein [Fervidobacterium sp.]HPZ18216.1 dihydrofolate reductase family protein [Fervidobacterium sp.]HQE49681.1 dihydrofolate reductase family protein [Fervidobacterium sp.]HUM43562.1 dihydrofolate reductase family protein [Fervidobacterium sp.]